MLGVNTPNWGWALRYKHGTPVDKVLRKNLVLKRCSKILLKNYPNFYPESAAFQKQKALGDKIKGDEETKERARYKNDSKKRLKRGGRVLITQNLALQKLRNIT